MKNIREVIETTVKKYPDKEYLFYKDQVYTYKEFNSRINQIANGFLRKGINKGDRVAVMMLNCPELVFAWLGLNKIGASFVPINTAFRTNETEFIITNSGAKVVIVDQSLVGILQKVRNNCPDLESVVVFGEKAPEGTLLFSDVVSEMPDHLVEVDIDYDDEAAILYTSGTTGNPKGCLEPHSYYLIAGEIYSKFYRISPNDRVLTPLPFFHMNPQILTAMGTLMSGASMVMVDRFHPAQWWNDIRRYHVTFYHYLGVVPSMLLGLPVAEGEGDLPRTRGMGGGVPHEIHARFEERFNTRLIETFGMTETGINFAVTPFGSDDERRVGTGCLGRSFIGYDAKIVDDDDMEVPPGTTGEIVLRSTDPKNRARGFMKEYYKDPKATEAAWRGGWFHTGDYGKIDEDGIFYYVDRKKDIIRRSGENISSREVEAAIITHPAVLEVAVIPVRDPIRVEEVKACIILKPGHTAETVPPHQIITWCEERIAYFKVPRYIEYRSEFPRTPTQKIQKQLLKTEKDDITQGCYDRYKDERFKKK